MTYSGADMSQSSLAALLQLEVPPVAIAFVDTPPAGVPRVSSPEPAGCGYWRRAADGEVFFTLAEDHTGCPVGAHTHRVPLTAPERDELMGLVKTMVDLSYLKMADVPKIAQRATPLQVAVYSPLTLAPTRPDVVLVRSTPRQLMLLAEAAESAGISGAAPAMGRPTCAVLPESINAGRTAVSFGCVGNRVYTGATDNEAYFAIPGQHLAALQTSLEIIVRANQSLEQFHQARARACAARHPRTPRELAHRR
ncbi:MAG: DUF169 domain-containing protein [Vicinamibacterales bacterium]